MARSGIEILLATYQGAAYIDDQLRSLAEQTLLPDRLLVADDGSSDDTGQRVSRFAESAPFPVEILTVERAGGPAANFARLLQASSAPLVAMCDQDDCWDRDKLAAGVLRMRRLEQHYGAQVPLCVHHDLRVMDAAGVPLRPSLHAWRGIEVPRDHRFGYLLYRSVLWGCTLTFNRRLIELALPIPTEAVMHDWWIALVAAAFGHIDYDPHQRISYRFHGNNVTETGTMPDGIPERLRYMAARLRRRAGNLAGCRRQARLFAERFATTGDSQHFAVRRARRCAGHQALGPFARRLEMVRGGYVAPQLSRLAAGLLIA